MRSLICSASLVPCFGSSLDCRYLTSRCLKAQYLVSSGNSSLSFSLTEADECGHNAHIQRQPTKRKERCRHAFYNRFLLGKNHETIHTLTYRPTQPRDEHR